MLPEFDARERHAIAVPAGAGGDALRAVHEVTPRDAPLLRALFRLRGLRAGAGRPLWEEMQRHGFAVLGPHTLGAIGKPWRPRGALIPSNSLSLERFRRFEEPGWAKMAIGFWVEDGLLVTETRVHLTDASARKVFRRYWLVVRPFSGLVRRSWLRAARRRVERGQSRGRGEG